jgi:hypothetical protein
MASKHTAHSGAHGPARIDITKRNKKRRADKRVKVAAKRKVKVEGRKLLRMAILATEAMISANRAHVTGEGSIAATA